MVLSSVDIKALKLIGLYFDTSQYSLMEYHQPPLFLFSPQVP